MLVKMKKYWYQDKEDGDGASGSAGGGDGDKGAGEGAASGGASGGSAGEGGAKKPAQGSGGGGAEGAGEGGGAQTWPEDWRNRYAGEDAKKMERLNRYASPAAAFDALLSLQSKIGAGELRSKLPDNATKEQVTAWRNENGIPESPDKYDLANIKVAAEDKPMIDSFLTKLHGANAPAGVAKEAVAWYYDEVVKRTEERLDKDKQIATASEDALRAEWGGEYRANVNMVNGLLETVPAEVRDLFKTGRMGDGTPIMSSPGVLKALVSWSRQINPVTTVVPNAGANIGSAIDDEIRSIENTMRTDRKTYNEDARMQERYRELLDAKSRIK